MGSVEVGPETHEDAFEAFAERATDRFDEDVREIVCFGSVARGETDGVNSDVDVLVVVEDATVERDLRTLAYEVQLEYGVVLSLHVVDVDRFEQRRDHPFFRTALAEGFVYD